MSIKSINEGFEKQFCEKPLEEEKGNHFDLLMALKRAREALVKNGERNLKAYEIAYQNVIEDHFPDKSWWEVTDCDIFNDLFNNRDPEHTEIEIVKGIKEDVDECLTEAVDGVVLRVEFEKYDRVGGNIRKVTVRGTDRVDALLNMLDKMPTPPLDPDYVEDDMTEEELIKEIKYNNGDGCDFIFKIEDKATGETLLDEGEPAEENESLKEEKDKSFKVRGKLAPRKTNESINVTEEIELDDFDFWGPAEEIVRLMTDDEKQLAQEYIEENYPNGIGKTELNDMFAYNDNFICMICDLEDIDELYDRRKNEDLNKCEDCKDDLDEQQEIDVNNAISTVGDVAQAVTAAAPIVGALLL